MSRQQGTGIVVAVLAAVGLMVSHGGSTPSPPVVPETSTQVGAPIVASLTGEDGLDKVILSCSHLEWQKVAMVIARTTMSLDKVGERVEPDVIAKRIVALVAAGRLESQGDLSRWRYSEVRLPSSLLLPIH